MQIPIGETRQIKEEDLEQDDQNKILAQRDLQVGPVRWVFRFLRFFRVVAVQLKTQRGRSHLRQNSHHVKAHVN
jgi:hypothetical protein